MEKGNKIIVDYKVKGMLLEIGTYPTIRKALSGKQDTPQCVRIREKAIELGGMEIQPKKIRKIAVGRFEKQFE